MDDYSVCRPFVPLRRYSVKDSGIRLNRYLFCDSRSCPNNQSCRNIQQGKTLRFRCPLQSAPVRTDGFFLPRNGCNIAPGKTRPRRLFKVFTKNFPPRILLSPDNSELYLCMPKSFSAYERCSLCEAGWRSRVTPLKLPD